MKGKIFVHTDKSGAFAGMPCEITGKELLELALTVEPDGESLRIWGTKAKEGDQWENTISTMTCIKGNSEEEEKQIAFLKAYQVMKENTTHHFTLCHLELLISSFYLHTQLSGNSPEETLKNHFLIY